MTLAKKLPINIIESKDFYVFMRFLTNRLLKQKNRKFPAVVIFWARF